MPRMNCPYCGDLVSYPKSQGGETSDCPYCDHEITLPPYMPKDRKKMMLFVVSLLGTLTATGLVTYVVWTVFHNFEFDPDGAGTLLQIVMGLLAVVIILLWIVFPVFVYHFLARIARATESGESLLQIISKKMDNR